MTFYGNCEQTFGPSWMQMMRQPLPLTWRRPRIKKVDGEWYCSVPCTEPRTLRQIEVEGTGATPFIAWAVMRGHLIDRWVLP